jgi:hypothetical protein
LERTRAERDLALEEVAFLREQLRNIQAHHVSRLESEYARLCEAYQSFLEELPPRLSAAFHWRTWRENTKREDERDARSHPAYPSIYRE